MLKFLALVGLLLLVGYLVIETYPDVFNNAAETSDDNTPVTIPGTVYHSLEHNIPTIPDPKR